MNLREDLNDFIAQCDLLKTDLNTPPTLERLNASGVEQSPSQTLRGAFAPPPTPRDPANQYGHAQRGDAAHQGAVIEVGTGAGGDDWKTQLRDMVELKLDFKKIMP